ncbi:MAG: CoA-binding protein [Flavobacteriales bacterium]|nr:CoA-binding protein [Flavobacteriales bacterium]
MGSRNVVVLGASLKPERISNLAVKRLTDAGYSVTAIGRKSGKIGVTEVYDSPRPVAPTDTVTLYLNAANQVPFYPYILGLKPARIIFNPGAENPELEALAVIKGIRCENVCTLVMLASGQF